MKITNLIALILGVGGFLLIIILHKCRMKDATNKKALTDSNPEIENSLIEPRAHHAQ